MWRAWAAGAWVVLATMGCGAPAPERADAAALFDLPEVSIYWQVDAFAVSDVPPRPDAGRVDRPSVNPCDAGLSPCVGASRCVDLLVDRANCGSCNATCDDRSDCLAGSCERLPGDEAICAGERVHLTTDTRHCGGCGSACRDVGGCIAGICEASCREGTLRCPGLVSCVDVQTDEGHCGACANACQLGEACHAGRCVAPCPGAGVRCPGSSACLDLETDTAHCGSCSRACSSGQVCEGRECLPPCAPGETRCNRFSCANLQSDRFDCGACGAACPYEHAASSLCRDGSCVVRCEVGHAQCGGPRSPCVLVVGADSANCGACGRACEAGERCVTGECIAPGPRPISPLSGTLNASRRPRFRWAPPPDGGAVVVEVCASRDCRTIEGSQTVAMGNELRWPTMLSPGPHWWRVRREGDGRVATFVWEVFILAEDSIVPLVGPARPDFNGDGMIGGTEFGAAWGGCHYGNPCTFAVVSDVNGDGYVDALIVQRTASPAPGMPGSSIVSNVERLRSGSSVGLVSPGVGGSGFRNIESIDAIGDINGDGYADMLLTEARYGTWSSDGIVRLLLGGAAPAVELTSSWPRDTTTMSSADFDGDGFQELVVIDNGRYSPGITVLSARCWLPDRCAIPHCGAVGLRDAPGQFINGWTDDVDRDGYPDLRVARFFWDGALTSEDWIWLGGPDGLTADRCSIGPSSRLP